MFLKQTTLLWSKHLFLKDCFTNNAVKYICFCEFKIIQINLPWVFAKKRNKSQANLEWCSRACCRSRHGSRLCTPWTLALKRFLVTVHSVLSVPASILNCSFFFFSFVRQTRALYASSSLFCAPPPTLGRTSYADKDGQGFGFAVMCLPVALYREGTPMSTGTGEQASLQHPQDYCLHFLPMSGGRQRHRESRSLSLVQDYYRSKLTKKGTSGCFKRKLSKQTVCAQWSSAEPTCAPRSLM